MLLGLGPLLSEIVVLCFRWCALRSRGKYSPLTQSVSEDHLRQAAPFSFGSCQWSICPTVSFVGCVIT